MKILKRLIAAVAVIALLSSCSVLRTMTSSPSSAGSSTGAAITALYKVLSQAGAIDLSSVMNILNLGKILTGAGMLPNATPSFMNGFSNGLISGSGNLINSGNVSGVISALQALSSVDSSAIMKAVDAANSGTTPQLSNSAVGVAPTLSCLNDIFALLN